MSHSDKPNLPGITYTETMETRHEVAIEVSLQPQDIYHPLLLCWPNVIRWVLSLFAVYLIYDARPVLSSALTNPNRDAGVLALLLVGAAIFLGWVFYPYFRVWSMFRSSPVLQSPRRIWFSGEGIRVESEHGRAEYKWSIFQKIVESRQTFFFMQTKRYAGSFYVPKRCLSKSATNDLRRVIRDNFQGESKLRID
jgi:hypothetical protein